MSVRAVVLAALLLAAPAWAGTFHGSDRADRLIGSESADTIEGRGGNDFLKGLGGRDHMFGGAGADRISAHYDDAADVVRCDAGRDAVVADTRDIVAADCEIVTRQVSRDPYVAEGSQLGTQVEPDSFAWGSTIVTAFQSGRAIDGGAANNGWAASLDGGLTWQSGFLPGLTHHSQPAGEDDRATDPVVAYDALHRWWLIGSLAASARTSRLLVSRSRDGVSWSKPLIAADDPKEDYDKEWLACDNWPRSPFRGRCYLSYLDVMTGEIRTRYTTDGGTSWSEPAGTRPALHDTGVVNGAMPAPRPDGSLVVIFGVWGTISFEDNDFLAVMRSTDGGRTFSEVARIATMRLDDIPGMRAPPLVTAEVDGGGRIWVAWHDCRFRSECVGSDVVYVTSRDGVRWSEPVRAPTGSGLARVDYFTPGIAVDPVSEGDDARVAIVYHSRPHPLGCFEFCPGGVDVFLIESRTGGRTWTAPQRLTVETMPMQWIAETALGRMLGDYVSASYLESRPVPVFALATEPDFAGAAFRQAIVATTRVAP